MTRHPRCLPSLAVSLVLVAAACSGDDTSDGDGGVTYAALRPADASEPADGACPVDLDAAVGAHIEAAEPATGRAEAVDDAPPATEVDPSSTEVVEVPARAEAVFVTCSVTVGDDAGSIDLLLYAAQGGSAPNWLLPQLAADADLDSDSVSEIADQLGDAEPGRVLAMPEGVDNVALLVTEIDGASSAALLLTGTEDIGAEQLASIATSLDQLLH